MAHAVRTRAHELASTGVYPNWAFILVRLGYEFYDPHPAIDDQTIKAAIDAACEDARAMLGLTPSAQSRSA